MTTTYLVAVSDSQAQSFLDHGYDLVAGFAVDAAEVAEVTDVSALLDLLHLRFPDSPFSDDAPLDVLHIPADAFTHARQAVGPLHPQAFRGGVIDFAPYDGTGVAEGGGVRTDLLLLDPCRLTAGSRLWRFFPGESEPVLRGVYHGIAFGWENIETGSFVAGVPSPYAGAVVQRDWGEIPCDVEVVDGQPVALTLVAPFAPDNEEGFEQLNNGLWAKRIAYDDSLRVFTQLAVAQLSGIPVRILRAVSTSDGEIKFHIVSLLTDAPYCSQVNFQRWAGATYTALAAPEHLENKGKQEATPVSWSVADRPAVTATRTEPFNITDQNALVQEVFNLLGQTTPPSWTEVSLQVQIIGDHVVYEANAKLGEDQGARLKVIPTAILHYLRQLKKLRIASGEGPFFTIVLHAVKEGQGTVSLNAKVQPPYADQVPQDQWLSELAIVEKSGHEVPEWLSAKVLSVSTPTSVFGAGATQKATSNTDLTANISATQN
ncbi:hypothetical protein [Arcanobacterium buesumense]|uniref:Uncharacterized protein n=1 Tax=Arcanobacterium buesumense TaxID=2722751 RepID=A0A6H2EKF9_9ACTO|nr:hypothetical protein [Arcanobacterium buesumense]QJC21177.1 hypothetical protein HC352_00670 [Arcanobacterium buesumense]